MLEHVVIAILEILNQERAPSAIFTAERKFLQKGRSLWKTTAPSHFCLARSKIFKRKYSKLPEKHSFCCMSVSLEKTWTCEKFRDFCRMKYFRPFTKVYQLQLFLRFTVVKDHPTENHPESPLGGTDTDKQNSSAQSWPSSGYAF